MLRGAGFDIVGGTPLFRLARHEKARLWFDRLARSGILTRPFQTKPDWLRFGIPHGRVQWDRIDAVLHSRIP